MTQGKKTGSNLAYLRQSCSNASYIIMRRDNDSTTVRYHFNVVWIDSSTSHDPRCTIGFWLLLKHHQVPGHKIAYYHDFSIALQRFWRSKYHFVSLKHHWSFVLLDGCRLFMWFTDGLRLSLQDSLTPHTKSPVWGLSVGAIVVKR